jgi:hypothetical protein
MSFIFVDRIDEAIRAALIDRPQTERKKTRKKPLASKSTAS